MSQSADKSLLAAVSAIAGTGSFHSTGAAPFFFPGMHVEGLGEVAFPLPVAQAKELVALADAAPHGVGEKTVLDENVRKCWQIDALRFSFKSPQWKKFLERTVAEVRKDLGVRGKISAHPYKLLIYGKGGHFKAHRDTEKLDAMFGTLIVALPSAHEGGRLRIRHGGQEVEVDFDRESHRNDFQHAAFFADCEHEVEPVRSGYRLCLAYNLRLDKGDPAALNPSLDAQARTLLPALAQMKLEKSGELRAVLLEHSYTEASFSLRHLKGNDQARARALFAAAKEMGYAAHLGLVTLHQSGSLDGFEYSDEDADEGSMEEVYDEETSIGLWRDAQDRRVEFGSYRIDKDVILSARPLGEGRPDEKQGEGYTGNEGCTMDYWYRRAAIVLWAQADQEAILCRYNFRGACASLAGLAAEKNTGPDSRFDRLAAAVISRYPDDVPPTSSDRNAWEKIDDGLLDAEAKGRKVQGGEDDERNHFAITLGALATAGSHQWLDRLVKQVPAPAFAACSALLWSRLYKAFGIDAFASVFDALLAGDPERGRQGKRGTGKLQVERWKRATQEDDGDFDDENDDEGGDSDVSDGDDELAASNRRALFQALSGLLASDDKEAASSARKIAAYLAKLDPRLPHPSSYVWEKKRDPTPMGDTAETRLLLAASHLLTSSADRRNALAFLQADSSLPYIRGILGPVLLEKPARKWIALKDSLAPELLAFAKQVLAVEIARPLNPYPDWTRPCPDFEEESSVGYRPMRSLSKTQRDVIRELAAFMADPNEKTHGFVHAEQERRLLENFIDEHFLDLDHVTIRRGRPYTLQCTKNDESYSHAVTRRSNDKVLLAKLGKL